MRNSVKALGLIQWVLLTHRGQYKDRHGLDWGGAGSLAFTWFRICPAAGVRRAHQQLDFFRRLKKFASPASLQTAGITAWYRRDTAEHHLTQWMHHQDLQEDQQHHQDHNHPLIASVDWGAVFTTVRLLNSSESAVQHLNIGQELFTAGFPQGLTVSRGVQFCVSALSKQHTELTF